MDSLTDLEGATLAEVAQRGVATSYAIANAFAQSPSEYWSGSAGAVYPVVKRLAKNGFLQAQPAATGNRQKLDYSITTSGKSALDGWLLDARRASGMGFDPLRTRLLYLDLVSPEQRRALLSKVRKNAAGQTDPESFANRPFALRVHHSWWNARAAWLRLLNFVAD